MSLISHEDVQAGQEAYTRPVLALYDALVLGASCRLLWKCPASVMLDRYARYMSANHLDVGVGTGYFLHAARPAAPVSRLALMDLNENCLAFASRRVSRYQPEVYRRNVLQNMNIEGGGFDSVSMNLLLHCVPGDFGYKGVIFDHVHEVLRPGGVLFGATLIARDIQLGWAAARAMAFYNRKGIFSNSGDSAEELRSALEKRFGDVEVGVHGCMALFSARKT